MDVQLPDGRIVTDVPDGTTQAELMRRLKLAEDRAPSVGMDVAKSAAVAVPKAALGLAGMVGDVRDLVSLGKDKLAQYLPEGLVKADKVASALSPVSALTSMYPSSGELRKPVEAVTGKFYEPQTRAGKVADTAVQTAATMGRNWATAPLKAAAMTAGVTAGTEGAGALTNDNPWARMIGGVLGGVPVAVLNAARSRPGVLARDAIGDVTEAEIQQAKQMEQQARAAGVPLMGTESLDRGHQLASAAYASPSGNPIIDRFLKPRAAQVDSAVRRDIISQTGPRDTPQGNASRAQKAAEDVIAGLERDRTAVVKPFYDAARQEDLPAAAVDAVRAKLIAAQRAAPASEQGIYQQYIDDLSARNSTNAGTLDEVYKRARDASDLGIGATTADKMAAAAARVAKPELEALTQQSQNLATGRQVYAANTRQSIEPVTSGPVGVVAGKTGFDPASPSPVPRITSVIGDANTARPETIRQLYTELNKHDRQAFPGIAQTYLENQLNAAGADLRSGANPTSGAKFRQAIAGDAQSKANFEETMRGVAISRGKNPDQVVAGANKLIDILERTGRTPGIGSQTAPRIDMNTNMERGLLTDLGRTASASPTAPWMDRLSQWVARGRWEDLARALTDPNSVEKLVRLGKMRPDGLSASYTAASLLGLDRAATQ